MRGARRLTLEELRSATNNFSSSNLIGHGMFGDVFNGLLQNGTVIAVKTRHSPPSQEFIQEVPKISPVSTNSLEEWHVVSMQEQRKLFYLLLFTLNSCLDAFFSPQVNYLSSIGHRNLVNFLGYCQENGMQMLVYEYVPNGSVSTHLHGEFSFCTSYCYSRAQEEHQKC